MIKKTLTLQVNVTITDKNEIIIGNGPYGLFDRYKLFIEEDNGEYRITDEIKHISDPYDTEEEAIAWVIRTLEKKELKNG